MSTWTYEAIVKRVVDGDTVDLEVDLGFRILNSDRFRLTGIDTPERGQVGWSEAKAALESRLPVGARVRVETEHPTQRDPKDKYGRWLASIWIDGEDLNLWMIEQGYAAPYQMRDEGDAL